MSVVSSYDCKEEPTKAEHAEALARFRAARGCYPGVSAELRRSRKGAYSDAEQIILGKPEYGLRRRFPFERYRRPRTRTR